MKLLLLMFSLSSFAHADKLELYGVIKDIDDEYYIAKDLRTYQTIHLNKLWFKRRAYTSVGANFQLVVERSKLIDYQEFTENLSFQENYYYLQR